MKINQKENLDALIKILLLDEIKESQKLPITPTIDYYCLQIISKHNIINSGILGLNFQQRESKLFVTIRNSITRVCQEDNSILEHILPKIFISDKNVDYAVLTKANSFSVFNRLLNKICLFNEIPIIEYDDFSYLELYKIKNHGFKTIFIGTNFTPYGIKERKVLHDRLKEFNIDSVNFLLNKSQCLDLFSMKLSLKEKLRHRDFFKEHGDDCFYLDQLDDEDILNEVRKIKELC